MDLPTLRQRLDLPVAIIGDEELDEIMAACREDQLSVIGCDPVGPSVDRALVRRVGRAVTARGMPLGTQNTEFGQAFIPAYDPILAQLEAGHLLGGFA